MVNPALYISYNRHIILNIFYLGESYKIIYKLGIIILLLVSFLDEDVLF